MNKLTNVEAQSSTKWFSATYIDGTGKEYEIVFTKTYTHNIGYEERELVSGH